MPEPQNFKNHTKFDPLFHYFLMPVLFLNIPASILWYVHHRHTHLHSGLWVILIAITLFLLVAKMRIYSLKVQDRVIRLEESIRMAALLPQAELPLIQSLTEQQFVALRFASDTELPVLTVRTVAENLTPKQIKAAIVIWRPDHFRV
jgi:hypothetical protein